MPGVSRKDREPDPPTITVSDPARDAKLRSVVVQSPWDNYQPKAFIHEDDVEEMRAAHDRQAHSEENLEAFGREHGIPALLDHLGLDGFANEVSRLQSNQAGWQLEWRAAGASPSGQDWKDMWSTSRRFAEQSLEGLRRNPAYPETWLESRTVSPPRPVSEKE